MGETAEDSFLAVQQTPQRVAALLREHQRLLAKIKQKKAERARLLAGIDEAMTIGQREGLPLTTELLAMDRQVHALFAELLARKMQPRKTRKIIREVYSFLQATEQISPEWFAAEESGEPGEPQWESESQGSPHQKEWESAQEEIPPWAQGGVTAKRGGEGSGTGSLRGLFHRLASALHPDKVQDDETKAERTEVMKELTQAYQAGDLARLIELERIWLLSKETETLSASSTQRDEMDERCAQLDARNFALRLQLEEEKSALRELRRSPQACFLADMKRMAKGSKQSPAEAWVESLRQQREDLRQLVQFVCSYRDGQIDIDTFHRGPLTGPLHEGPMESHAANEDELFAEVLAMLRSSVRSPKPRSRRQQQQQPDPAQGDLF